MSSFTAHLRNIAVAGLLGAVAAQTFISVERKWNDRKGIPPFYANTILTDGGSHYVYMSVNGSDEHLVLLDTGASDVFLTPKDAREFNVRVVGEKIPTVTASKVIHCRDGHAEVSVGQIKLKRVEVSVCPDITRSVLGMTFLSRVSFGALPGKQIVLRYDGDK